MNGIFHGLSYFFQPIAETLSLFRLFRFRSPLVNSYSSHKIRFSCSRPITHNSFPPPPNHLTGLLKFCTQFELVDLMHVKWKLPKLQSVCEDDLTALSLTSINWFTENFGSSFSVSYFYPELPASVLTGTPTTQVLSLSSIKEVILDYLTLTHSCLL